MYQVKLTESYLPAVADAPIDAVTIGEALAQAAADSPGLAALKEMTPQGTIARSWTFKSLYEDAHRLATALAGRHPPGARIAIWASNSPEWVLLEYAAALAGLTIVTVNPSFQARELDFVLRQSGASALYLVESYRGNPMSRIAAAVCAEIPAVQHLVDIRDERALFDGAESARALPIVKPIRKPRDPFGTRSRERTHGRTRAA